MASSHPPASDLVCSIEPAPLTAEQVAADPEGLLDRKFLIDVIMAGRNCRDALKRACLWHQSHGMPLYCSEYKYP